MAKRQLWDLPTTTAATWSHHCTPFTLPSKGVLSFDGTAITLTTNAVFAPECTGKIGQEVSSIASLKFQPFYASTIPQTYVIAAATVIAWILVVMLIITPRTNFAGHSNAAQGFSNGHGLIGGATGGGTSLIGVGSRPWLQKAAALTVAISLTIATADTFECAKEQYLLGYMDADKLRDQVLGSLEIRITRVISDVFLWLAQVQTLIRLFPRHKEKVLIKWIGFALILFDTIFSSLNSFMIDSTHSPRDFVDAIPALSYLFQLALGLLYAAWVIYYSLTKRRYAFYHSKMRSISLIALLSLVAILTPVVFFVTDVSNQDVAGWGDYFRWVGAAAASVVVWEWVERIEALERDEKKDDILGREVFDGDEMLDVSPSDEIVWHQYGHSSRPRYRREDDSDGNGGNLPGSLESGFVNVAQRFRPRRDRAGQEQRSNSPSTSTVGPSNVANNAISFGALPRPNNRRSSPRIDGSLVINGPTPPAPVASPVSRADTTSAASTVYVVQYNPTADIPQPVRRRIDVNANTGQERARAQAQRQEAGRNGIVRDPEKEEFGEDDQRPNHDRSQGAWLSVTNPFKRKRASPPAEVQQARQVAMEDSRRATTPAHNFTRWDIKNRLGVLAAETGERWRDRNARRREVVDLPVTIIPAQPRGRTWIPAAAGARHISRATEATESSYTGDDFTVATEDHERPISHRDSTYSAVGGGYSPATAGPSNSAAFASSSNYGQRVHSLRAEGVRPLPSSSKPIASPTHRSAKVDSPLTRQTPARRREEDEDPDV